MYRIDLSADSQSEFPPGIQVAALEELLSDGEIELICRHLGHTWRDRIFTPPVTVRSMVYRALNPDKSIRAVLTDLAVTDERLEQTPADASWCEARSRLPGDIWPELIQHSVGRLEDLISGRFLYHGRPVFLLDGSTLSMPVAQQERPGCSLRRGGDHLGIQPAANRDPPGRPARQRPSESDQLRLSHQDGPGILAAVTDGPLAPTARSVYPNVD